MWSRKFFEIFLYASRRGCTFIHSTLPQVVLTIFLRDKGKSGSSITRNISLVEEQGLLINTFCPKVLKGIDINVSSSMQKILTGTLALSVSYGRPVDAYFEVYLFKVYRYSTWDASGTVHGLYLWRAWKCQCKICTLSFRGYFTDILLSSLKGCTYVLLELALLTYPNLTHTYWRASYFKFHGQRGPLGSSTTSHPIPSTLIRTFVGNSTAGGEKCVIFNIVSSWLKADLLILLFNHGMAT